MNLRYVFAAIFLMVLAGPLAAQPVEGPNGNFYEYVSTPATWADARTAAEGMSFGGAAGYLATATSTEENNFMATLGAATSAYFGGFQLDGTAEPAAEWQWVSGEAWSFTAWGPGEPNDSGGEDCVHYRSDGLWNDITCSGVRPYVVEYDAVSFVPQTNTFPTSAVVAGGGDAGTPDMTITCDSGLPLTQTAPVGTTFSVTELAAGSMCTVVLASDVDDGYEATAYTCTGGTVLPEMAGCSYTTGVGAAAFDTVVQIAAESVDFEVTVMWEVSQDADPGVGEMAQVGLGCLDSSVNGYTSTTADAAPGDTMPVTLEVVPPALCGSTLFGVGSAVEVDDMDCRTVEFGIAADAEDTSCTIYATAFYEGIPTLSQYGMAIMVLLMLGVGCIGFRRFV